MMDRVMKPAILTLILLLTLLHPAAAATVEPADHRAITAYAKELLLHSIAGKAAPVAPQSIRSIQRACFVTFFHKGRVFACFGGFTPRTGSLAEEIRENIRLALKNDSRAANVRPETAADCRVQITLPGQLQKIDDLRNLDPSREGLFVEASDGRGIAIVPGEAKTAGFALRSALSRLGLTSAAPGLRLYRFSAIIIR